MGRSLHRVTAATLVAQLAGCSFLFVERPPKQVPPGVWVQCTEGKTWPIVDAVIGTTMLLSAVGIGTTTRDSTTMESSAGAAVAAGVNAVVSIGVLYSAYAGFKWTNRCSRQHEDAEARGIYGPTPYPYGYPYPPPQQPYPPQTPPGQTPPTP